MSTTPIPPDEPVSEERAPAQKQSKPGRFVGIVLLLVVAILVVSLGLSSISGFRRNAEVAKQRQGAQPLPRAVDPSQITAFGAQEENDVRNQAQATALKNDQAFASDCLAKGGVPQQQAMGKMACTSPDGDSILPLTPAQQQAILTGATTPGGVSSGAGTESARQRKEEARKKALESNMLAIDFTSASEKPSETSAEQKQQEPETETGGGSVAKASPVEGGAAPPEGEEVRHNGQPATAKEQQTKYDFDQFSGKQYRMFEGTVLETILTNRINGEFPSPVNVMVATDVYSHNRQELLIPRGTRILGVAKRVTDNNQQRLAVTFQRLIMPDGFSLDLDRFIGLDQIGAAGLTGRVNRHYLSLFGTSIALGAIAGITQVGNSMSGFGYDPQVAMRSGISQRLGEESEQILSRALNRMPTITIPEGSRVRIWLTQDVLVPAYANHQTPADL